MSSGFLPERIIRTRNRDGSYTHSEVYTYENWTNIQFVGAVMVVAFIIMIAPFASLILFGMYLFGNAFNDKGYAYIAIIISLYFVIDFFNGWLLNSIITIFSGKESEAIYVSLNLSVLCSSVLTLFFAKEAEDGFEFRINLNKLFIGILIAFVSFCIAESLFQNNIIKIPASYYENKTEEKTDDETSTTVDSDAKIKDEDVSTAKEPIITDNSINTDNSNSINNDDFISIGNQQWAIKNLNTSFFRNGDEISEAVTAAEWSLASNEQRPAWCYADANNSEKLYNWYAVSDSRGLAPEGWHIPNTEDWFTLYNELGGYPSALHKLTVSVFFDENESTEKINFGASPIGMRYDFGTVFSKEPSSNWWTAEASDSSFAYYQTINADCFKPGNENVSKWGMNKGTGMSVRCVRD